MESKFDKFIKNIDSKHLKCPMCFSSLDLVQKSFKCVNNHTFDINKKGYVKLLKKFKPYKEKIYSKELFIARRNLILKGFYDELNNNIAKIINKYFNTPINVIDIGCGEGSHAFKLKNFINIDSYYIIDLNTEAVELATDYLNENLVPIVCDVYNLPFFNVFDVVIDILSPYNYEQINNILKDDGLFIKVSPTKNYLKEIRQENGIQDYKNEESVVNNYKSHFNVLQEFTIEKTYKLSNEDAANFLKMTPLTQKLEERSVIKEITLSLNIIVGRKKC